MCKKLLPLLFLLLSSSCTQSQVQPAVTNQLNPTKVSLANVTAGVAVEIKNDWNGYSDITPIVRHQKLWLKPNKELTGNSYIAVGGHGAGGIDQQATAKVKIPAAVTVQFLATLAKTPIKTGTYKPLIKHSDDYPSVMIRVKSPQQQTIFTSQSQGVGRIPWKITIQSGKTSTNYISNSHLPTQALKLLSPYIDNPGIDEIIQRRTKRK